MNFLEKLFGRKRSVKQPEDYFTIIVTSQVIRVLQPQRKEELINWSDIKEIKIINTDAGPWQPDVWLTLVGDNDSCMIPQGAEGFTQVFEIISKYEGFNFDNFLKSMRCTDNQEFQLWNKVPDPSQ